MAGTADRLPPRADSPVAAEGSERTGGVAARLAAGPHPIRQWLGRAAVVGSWLAMLGYPLGIWYCLTHFTPRVVGLFALAVLLPTAARRLYRADPQARRAVLRTPLAVAVLLGLAVLLDDARFMQALPVLVNLTFLLDFSRSLQGQPMVERYARLVHPDLGPAEVRHCRAVTVVWCAFFAANAAVAAGLALWAPFAWLALYTGLVAYVLVGVLFGAEYLVRIARFGRRREAVTGLVPAAAPPELP